MPFPWLHPQIPDAVKARFPAQNLAMQRREVRERAGLLRRLGYSRNETLHRCASYLRWEYEPFHRSQIRGELTALVDEVYRPQSGRSDTLTPGQ